MRVCDCAGGRGAGISWGGGRIFVLMLPTWLLFLHSDPTHILGMQGQTDIADSLNKLAGFQMAWESQELAPN